MNKIITHFDTWLSSVDLDGHEEVFALYEAVRSETSGCSFSCTRTDSQLEVTSTNTKLTLLLKSQEAKVAFLALIEGKFCDGVDIESWYGFEHAMSRND